MPYHVQVKRGETLSVTVKSGSSQCLIWFSIETFQEPDFFKYATMRFLFPLLPLEIRLFEADGGVATRSGILDQIKH